MNSVKEVGVLPESNRLVLRSHTLRVEQDAELRRMAKRKKTTKAKLMRAAVDHYLESTKQLEMTLQ